MSFLRSVIKDARPHKSMLESSSIGPVTGRWNAPEWGADVGRTTEKFSGAADGPGQLSTSPHDQEEERDFSQAGTELLQEGRDTQSVTGNNELESISLRMVDKPTSMIDEESHVQKNTGNLPDQDSGFDGDEVSATEVGITQQTAGYLILHSRMNFPEAQSTDPVIDFADAQTQESRHNETKPVSSSAIPWDTPAGESSNHDSNHVPKPKNDSGQLGEHENITSVANDQPHSESKIRTQADAIQLTDLKSSESSHRVQSSKHVASLEPSILSSDSSQYPTSAAEVAAVPHMSGAHGNSQHSVDTAVDDLSASMSLQPRSMDNSGGRNETDNIPVDNRKADQVSPGVNKQMDLKSLSKQETNLRSNMLAEVKNAYRDVQSISPQSAPVATQGSSNLEIASATPFSDQKIPLAASTPASVSPMARSPEQHPGKPSTPSTGTEALRSVIAMPFQTDTMPKTAAMFRSSPLLNSSRKNLAEPKVQIGQIDVIIEAAVKPASRPASSSSTIDLASRYYLRSL